MDHHKLGHLPQITADDIEFLTDLDLRSSLAPPNATPCPPISHTTLPTTTNTEYTAILEFKLFPKFPFELRLMVWSFGIIPRFVQLRAGGGKPPALLHACQESRTEGQKSYAMCDIGDSGNKDVIFINQEKDIVYCIGMYSRRSSSFSDCLDILMGRTPSPCSPFLLL